MLGCHNGDELRTQFPRFLLVLLEFHLYLFLSRTYFGALLSILLSQPFLLKPIATASHDSTSRRSFPGSGAWDRRSFATTRGTEGACSRMPSTVGATISHRVSQEQRTRVDRATQSVARQRTSFTVFRRSIPDEKQFFPGISVPVLT